MVTRGTISAPGDAEFANGVAGSANLLGMLGVKLALGRTFLPEEDRAGAAPVAILSYPAWQRRFGGSAAALGAQIVFDGKPYTVIGVAPAGFRFDDGEPALYTLAGQTDAPMMRNREAHRFAIWARLRPGATLERARTELAVLGKRLEAEYPKSNRGRTFIADPLRPDAGDTGQTLWLLLGAVSLVLLIACTNIASLLLARAVSRERELAMRVALGAGRGRLVRQCLTESAVLALGGGIVGVLFAWAAIKPFVTFWPGGLPRAEAVILRPADCRARKR